MICWMTKIFLPLLIITLSISRSGPLLEEYLPKNQEEKKIILLLIQYQDAKIYCDLDQFLACLYEKGNFHFGRGFMLSKKELKESLPSFWAGLQSGSPEFYPMNREMITGNYILTGRFFNPQIVINQESAEVIMTFMKWGWRLRHYISMIKQNDQWLITRLDWETN